MRNGSRVSVVIPAFNEERAIRKVIESIPGWVDEVIVADNGSLDRTVDEARQAGARVVHEPRRGYGSACLRGIASAQRADVIVFLDGDFSDHPEEMHALVDPVVSGEADMVIGSRVRGAREPGALTLVQRFGNGLSCTLIRLLWGMRYTDLGPFRAVRTSALRRLQMRDPDYGWTVEMQVKAAQAKMRVLETPVRYRNRIGISKISGTLRGVWNAGTKILYTIAAAALRRAPCASRGGAVGLMVLTRYPEVGRVKTRLIPALGASGACEVHRELVMHTLNTVRALEAEQAIDVRVFVDGGSADLMRDAFGAAAYMPQGDGDLGARLQRAFAEGFQAGAAGLLAIGTDCPSLQTDHLHAASSALISYDVVLGPALDGGYYLIGLRKPAPQLFEKIAWGSALVLQQTLERAAQLGLSTCTLEPLADVDRPEDVAAWRSGGRSLATNEKGACS